MNEKDIYQRLDGVFQDVFDNEEIHVGPETSAVDIEDWDSLAQITLTLAVEEEFGIRFDMAEITGFENVGQMVESIARKGAA